MTDLEILLEGGPADTSTLARWLRLTVNETEAQLRRLERQGRVQFLRSVQRWALGTVPAVTSLPAASTAGSTVGAAAPADRSRADGARRTSEPADSDGPVEDDALLEGVDDDIPDLEDFDAPPPRRPGRKPSLRQEIPADSRGPAWWVGLSREQHQAEAARRSPEMGRSREARSIGYPHKGGPP